MRGGDAKHRRPARMRAAADPHWSARAQPARVQREAPYYAKRRTPNPSESEAFARTDP